jgi:SAM-dependent methyltransferase
MFDRTIRYYDKIYAFKDYAAEARQVTALAQQHGPKPARTLLDLACGTGAHLAHLRGSFAVEGVDLMPEMVAAARERLPEVPFHVGDMRSLDLGRRFDVVTCLFSSIGYCLEEADLHAAWRTIARHLVPGGLAVVEPWLQASQHTPGHVGLRVVDEPGLKLVRVDTPRLEGRRWILDMHHLIGTADGVEHVVEPHVLASWTPAEMEAAIRAAGLAPRYVPDALPRGAWLASA